MMRKETLTIFFYIFIGIFMAATAVTAEDKHLKESNLPPLTIQKIILTIVTDAGVKKYTYGDIESLGLKQMETPTFWPEDDGIYQGVLLKDLLRHAGIENNQKIILTALDDYSAEIPREDWEKWPILLATRKAGKAISIRQRGPTRIIYPKYMGGAVAETEMRIRWIWAIKQIVPKQ